MEIKLIEDGGEWEQIGELTFEMDRKAKLPNSLYVSDYYEYMIFRKYKEEKKRGERHMPEVKLSPLEQKLEKLFKDHEVPLPRNLRASLTGLIASEVTTATGSSFPTTIRDIKLPRLPDIEKTRYHDE